jgi:adenylate cyclase
VLPLEAGVALHYGDVVYGNIGSEARLDFTVIGAAVNEATRIEALCRTLGRPLLISAEFAKVCTCHPLVSLGHHRLRGVGEPQEIFTPTPRAP